MSSFKNKLDFSTELDYFFYRRWHHEGFTGFGKEEIYKDKSEQTSIELTNTQS